MEKWLLGAPKGRKDLGPRKLAAQAQWLLLAKRALEVIYWFESLSSLKV